MSTSGKSKLSKLLSANLWRLCAISTSFTILAILLSVVMAQVYIVQNVSFDVPYNGNATSMIKMDTDFMEVDTKGRTLTLDCNLLNAPPDPNTISSNDPFEQGPIYKLNMEIECNELAQKVANNFDTFRTAVKLVGQQSNSKWTGPSLQWYPWDVYIAQLSLYARLDSTNASVGTIIDPFGSPLNHNVELNSSVSWNTNRGLYLAFKVKRSLAVKLLVTIIVIANWMATVTFLWITVASWLWPEHVVQEMFVIPIAALFAFTSVRSNMPGAPAGFGALIDYIGILPNIALMAIFSATLLLVVLIRRTKSGLQGTGGEPVSKRLSSPEENL